MNAAELTALVVAAIGAVGAVALQGLQMYFSYLRDQENKEKVKEAVKNTNVVNAKVDSVVAKIDDNTAITTQAKDAATNFKQHSEACTQDIRGHEARIATLEAQIGLINKNIDSTRHEMRTNLQTVMNKLDTMMLVAKVPEAIAQAKAGK